MRLKTYVLLITLAAVLPASAIAADPSPSPSAKPISDAEDRRNIELCKRYGSPQNPDDPCAAADLQSKTGDIQYVTASVYAAAAVACGVACGYPAAYAACAIAGGVTLATDITGQVIQGKAGEAVIGAVQSGVTMLSGPIISALTPATNSAAAAGNAAANTAASGGESAGSTVAARIAACGAMVLNGAQSGFRFWGGSESKKAAMQTRSQKAALLALQNPSLINNLDPSSTNIPTNSLAGGGGSAGQYDPTTTYGQTNPNTSNNDNVAFNNMLASTGGPAFAQLEKLTGKPVGPILSEAHKRGIPPLKALTALAEGKIDPSIAKDLNSIHDAAPQIAARNKSAFEDLDKKSGLTQRVFEVSGVKTKVASKDPGLGDFNSLLASLMPKKAEDATAAKAKASGASFKSTLAAKEAQSKGFHAESESLFDVVGTRYQSVTTRFLAGESLVGMVDDGSVGRTPASAAPMRDGPDLVPNNPYTGR